MKTPFKTLLVLAGFDTIPILNTNNPIPVSIRLTPYDLDLKKVEGNILKSQAKIAHVVIMLIDARRKVMLLGLSSMKICSLSNVPLAFHLLIKYTDVKTSDSKSSGDRNLHTYSTPTVNVKINRGTINITWNKNSGNESRRNFANATAIDVKTRGITTRNTLITSKVILYGKWNSELTIALID